MITLKTSDKFKFGQTNVLPFVGETKISHKGEIFVEDLETAKALEKSGIGFFIDQDSFVDPDKEMKLKDEKISKLEAELEASKKSEKEALEASSQKDEKIKELVEKIDYLLQVEAQPSGLQTPPVSEDLGVQEEVVNQKNEEEVVKEDEQPQKKRLTAEEKIAELKAQKAAKKAEKNTVQA